MGLAPRQTKRPDWRPILLAYALRARPNLRSWAWYAGEEGLRSRAICAHRAAPHNPSLDWGNGAILPEAETSQHLRTFRLQDIGRKRAAAPAPLRRNANTRLHLIFRLRYAVSLSRKGGKLPPPPMAGAPLLFTRRSRSGAAFFGKTGLLPRFFPKFCLIQGFFLVYLPEVV